MALIHCNFYSKYLGYDTQVNVILPENKSPYEFDESRDYKFQTLYLLHGLGDDCNGWLRGTSIERYATDHRIAVVMPTGENSFYLNKASGKQYFSYMTEELPQRMAKWFPLSSEPEDTYLAGLSMGGYGTLKIALTYPERFHEIAIFSAAVDPCTLLAVTNAFDDKVVSATFCAAFGEDEVKAEDDPIRLLESRIAEGKKIPKIIQYEGKQDFLYEMNRTFCDKAKELGAELIYEEWEGEHNWKFWDRAIEKALDVFPLKNQVLFRD